MECKKCGVAMFEGDIFCWNCGTKVSEGVRTVKVEQEDNTGSKYESYGSELYGGSGYYVEYKGYIYALMPKAEITKKGDLREHWLSLSDSDMQSNLIFIRFGVDNNKIEILKEFQIDNDVWERYTDEFGVEFSRDYGMSRGLPFTIYDNKIYYTFKHDSEYLDEEKKKYFDIITSLDIHSKQEIERSVELKTSDSGVAGVFQGSNKIVYIMREYNYNPDFESYYICDLDGARKKMLANRYDFRIIGYNERYVYYTLEHKRVYCVDLDTFEIINLHSKLTKVDGSFLGIDTRTDTLYFYQENYGEKDKLISVSIENEQNEFLVPKLSNAIVIKNEITFASEWHSGIVFNGENWIMQIQPIDVEIGKLEGIIIFDKKGNEVERWMYEKRTEWISYKNMIVMLPSALVVEYRIEDEKGNHTGLSNFIEIMEGKRHWCARMIYCEKNGIMDSQIDFYYKSW